MHTENEYHRGEIFFINEGESSGSEQGGARPGIIVSNDVGNKHAPIVEVVYLTSREKYLAKATMDEMKQIDKALAVSIGLGGNMKMSEYVREWAEAFKEPDPDPIEEKAMQILKTAKPVQIQIPERLFDKERIKELEKDLIRVEAERDVFQKLYKEQLAIS